MCSGKYRINQTNIKLLHHFSFKSYQALQQIFLNKALFFSEERLTVTGKTQVQESGKFGTFNFIIFSNFRLFSTVVRFCSFSEKNRKTSGLTFGEIDKPYLHHFYQNQRDGKNSGKSGKHYLHHFHFNLHHLFHRFLKQSRSKIGEIRFVFFGEIGET